MPTITDGNLIPGALFPEVRESFHSMKQLRALLLYLPTPLRDMLFHHQNTILWRLVSLWGTGMSPRRLQTHPPQEYESYKFPTNNNKLINTYKVHDVLITHARFKSSHFYITCISHVSSSFIHLSLNRFQFFSNLEMILSHQKITPLTKDIKQQQNNSLLSALRFQFRPYILSKLKLKESWIGQWQNNIINGLYFNIRNKNQGLWI